MCLCFCTLKSLSLWSESSLPNPLAIVISEINWKFETLLESTNSIRNESPIETKFKSQYTRDEN